MDIIFVRIYTHNRHCLISQWFEKRLLPCYY